MMVVRQDGSVNRSAAAVVAAVKSALNASSHRDSRTKEDLDKRVLDKSLHSPGRKQTGVSGMMLGKSSFNPSSSSALLSLSQVDLAPHTEWGSRKKINRSHASSINNETCAEAGDGKYRPSENKARAASLWKAVKKEVRGGSSVHRSESESRVKNRKNLASHGSAPAGLNTAKFFPKGGDENTERSSEKKAPTSALWKVVKKEVMGGSTVHHQAELESRKKNKSHLTSLASESSLSIVQPRPKEGDENTERPSEKKARASVLWKIVKKDIIGSSVPQTESEARMKNETDQTAKVSTENATAAESGPKDGDESTYRPSEKKVRASSLWKIVKKDIMMGSSVNQKESESRKQNEAEQAAEVSTEKAGTVESGSKYDCEQADRRNNG